MYGQTSFWSNLFTTPFNWIFGKIQFLENCRRDFHFCQCETDNATFASAFFCRREIIWVRKTVYLPQNELIIYCLRPGNFSLLHKSKIVTSIKILQKWWKQIFVFANMVTIATMNKISHLSAFLLLLPFYFILFQNNRFNLSLLPFCKSWLKQEWNISTIL